VTSTALPRNTGVCVCAAIAIPNIVQDNAVVVNERALVIAYLTCSTPDVLDPAMCTARSPSRARG